MNAEHILSRWERIKPVLTANKLRLNVRGRTVRPLVMWLAMLQAARGPTSAPDLQVDCNVSLSSGSFILRMLAENGLVERCGQVQLVSKPRRLWKATPKLLHLLGLEGMKEEVSYVPHD